VINTISVDSVKHGNRRVLFGQEILSKNFSPCFAVEVLKQLNANKRLCFLKKSQDDQWDECGLFGLFCSRKSPAQFPCAIGGHLTPIVKRGKSPRNIFTGEKSSRR
jgi:hypothetical protein